MQSHNSTTNFLRKRSALLALWLGACLLGTPFCPGGDAVPQANGGAARHAAAAPSRSAKSSASRYPWTTRASSACGGRCVRRWTKRGRRGAGAVLIFEFAAPRGGAEAAQGTSFGDAYDLANFLSSEELNAATTVAYLPQSIRGHAVLLALACDQIIMADGATIGAAGADEKVIGETVQSAYREIAGRRRTLPEELAVAMLRPRADVLMVHTEASTEYVTPAGLEELRKRHAIQSQEVVVRQGEPAVFSAAELRRLGFCQAIGRQPAGGRRRLGIAGPGRRRGPVARRALAGGPRRCERPRSTAKRSTRSSGSSRTKCGSTR